MNRNILSIINQLLAYSDSDGVTDNPRQRSFDWTRRYCDIPIMNPTSDTKVIPSGSSLSIFNGSRDFTMILSSPMSLALQNMATSKYRLTVTTSNAFRTARTATGITTCAVTVNNNAIAVFNFAGYSSSDIIVGDIMRIKGVLYDDGNGPFAFNSLNAGLWVIVGLSGTQISCIRPTGQVFSAAAESVAVATADVSFYSAAGIQKGDKMVVGAGFSVVSQRTYEVLDAQPTVVDFISATPLPQESGISFVSGSLAFYTNSKRLVYLEADQDCVVQMNGDTGQTNHITPIAAGERHLPGFMHKFGDTYSCTIVNTSVNPLTLKYLLGE